MANNMFTFNTCVVWKISICFIVCFLDESVVVSADGPTSVTVTVPADVWEGEGATMTCTPDVDKASVALLLWYKNTLTNIVYGYSSSEARANNDLKNRAVGQWVGSVHQLHITKTEFSDEATYICESGSGKDSKKLTVNARPQGVTITGLAESVRENTEVEVTCDVSQVRPKADIYWRKGDDGTPQAGTTTSENNSDGKTFKLHSTYKVSFSRSDHNTLLYCLVTRPEDNSDVWGSSNKIVSVSYPPSTKVTQKTSGNPTEGGSVTLTCDITDGRPRNDIKSVTWKKGGQEVTSSGRNNISGTDLTISSLDHSKDDGSYTCAAENAVGMGGFGEPLQLQIYYKPTVSITTPSPAVEGQPVTIACSSLGSRPAVTRVTWKKGQQVVRVTTDTKYTGGTVQTPSLTIKRATRTDAGQYKCQLINEVGQDTGTVTLQVWYLPNTRVTRKTSGNPTERGSVTLTCNITDGRPRDDIKRVTWKKGGQEITSSDQNNLSGKDLTISSLDHSKDDGSYTCAAENAAGMGGFGEALQLHVLYLPSTRVTQKTSGNPAEGGSVTLTCDITDGRPRDDIKRVTWKKGGQEVTSSGRNNLSGKDLTISSLDHSKDDGSYTCAAENAAGMGGFGEALQLQINYPPSTKVTQKTSGNPTEGGSVTLTCDITDGRPRYDIKRVTWRKGGQEVTSSGRNNISGRDLTISSLDHSKDDGSYTCAAENAAGMGGFGEALQLHVLYKPLGQATTDPTSVTVAVEEQVSLTCLAPTEPGNPAASWFTWHKENSDFTRNTTGVLSMTPSRVDESGKFSCVAGNWIGQSDNSDWATVRVQAPAMVEYPRIDNIPRTTAFDDTDFNMTCTVSGSGDVKVDWLKDRVSVDTSDFAVTTVSVTDRQYMYGQTDTMNSTLVWKVTERARYFTCGNITHFDGLYTCAVTTETAGAMTRDVSKAFFVNVLYEAHWSSGPTLTAAALNETSKVIVCSVCANPQPSFQWTLKNQTLRDGIIATGNRITLDVVRTEDFGSYMCSVNNEVNGEERSELFHIDLVERGPAREPLEFSVLHNHTSVALTLQWRPGFDGGYGPQTFTLQYKASNEVALITWSDIFMYTTDETTWHQSTVTGLQPQTQYVFSLYAENSRPRNKGPNRSLTVTRTGSTTASPDVIIQSVMIETVKMTVEWSFNGQSSQRKKSTSTNVSVVIYYQPDGGVEAHYPLEGSVAAEERQVTINGQFDDKVKYKVWFNVFEGQLVVSSQQTNSFETTALSVEKRKEVDANNSTIVIATASAGVGMLVIGLIVGLVIGIVCMRRRRQSAKKDDVAEMSGPGTKHSSVRKDKDVISTTELSGDSIQYENLNEGHSSEVSAQQGTYATIDASGETTGQTTYEYIGADGPQKLHAYINTAVVRDDAAEYSEVKETVAAEATRGQPTYQNISTKNTAN